MTLPEETPGPTTTRTTNCVQDASVGVSVQAGSITGGIAFYTLPPDPPPPRQLPRLPAAWVDRDADLTLLQRRAGTPVGASGIRVIALHGPAGTGTTALAARLLHDLKDAHPGGQLYVDLRGGEPDGPLTPGKALGQLLRSVRPGTLPADARERAGWWRSVTAGRAPTCVLLDNAVDADTVRACLPAGDGHLVLVTSRHPLVELAADGAHLHPLGPLPPSAARQYLAIRAGEARVRAEPHAAEQLVQLAAGLPTALVLTAAQLSLHPQRSLSGLAQALAPAPSDQPGAIMTTHIGAAYAGLDRPTARTYRVLSRLPVHDVDATLVAAVCDITPEAATGHLDDLAAAGLLEITGTGEPPGPAYRFASPEVRERVLQFARTVETDGEVDEILRRALGWAMSATVTADALITPSHHRTLNISTSDLPYAPHHPVRHADADAALAWLTGQSDNVLALVRSAARAGHHDYVWRIVYSLWPWWRAAGRHDDWIELHLIALESVRHDLHADSAAERHLLNTYGLGLRSSGDPNALGVFTRVREAALRADDALGEAQALYELGATHLTMKQPAEAIPVLERARGVRAEQGYERGVALVDILLGQALLSLGRLDEALHRLQGARAALDGVDAHDAARALAWQGRVQVQAGDIPAGETSLNTALREFRGARAPRKVAQTVEWLAHAAETDGRVSDARALYEQAIAQYRPVSGIDADRVRDHLARLV
ncbi:tetratricopeptide repeat protein [Streptomyces sp. CS7]|uniref:tetratricopeptide repeat protein n=1 Tax=Streptomyces sp. CS-7 TaxID=2906769 RepID=UPI0021B3D5BA|nr:tetratricopeptide repeat protein [Streptomyces sp. CS-7]MCT6780551.1 tetratricopeptide repeat protein [Streptomyces sp. CS-7]